MGVFRKDKIWFIDYYVNGKRFRESIGPGTKRDAEKALAKRKVQIKEERFFDKRIQSNMSFEEMVATYLAFSKEHRKSHASNIDVCRRLTRFFGGKKIIDIFPSDVEQYKESRRQHITRKGTPVALSTINRELACLKRMFNRLLRDGKIEKNPVCFVSLYNEDHLQRDRVLTPEEYECLLANCNSQLREIVEVAYHTAMRRGEILNLTWEKVDLKSGFIHLAAEETKTARKRSIPLSERVSEILRAKVRRLDTNLVFHRDGQRILSIREAFQRACNRALIEDFHFHDLRHSAITRWMKAGVPENAIMMVSGHRTRKVFDRYVNLSPGDVKCMLLASEKNRDEQQFQIPSRAEPR